MLLISSISLSVYYLFHLFYVSFSLLLSLILKKYLPFLHFLFSIWTLNGLGEAYIYWEGLSTLFTSEIQIPMSCRNTLTGTIRNNALQTIWVSPSPVKLTYILTYITKHHDDHVMFIPEMKAKFSIRNSM